MASLSSLPSVIINIPSIFPSLTPFSQTKTKNLIRRNPFHYIPCRAAAASNEDSPTTKFDRRDLLLGIGGLSAATLGGVNNSASAYPVITPNISNCGPSTILSHEKPVGKIDCCPPSPDEIIDFIPPPSCEKLRQRPAAHLIKANELEKFEEAIKRMKKLDPSDPRNFYQQANIHCAYCNGGYEQDGFPGIDLQVHGNWLFYPFHRCYLYFYERILGHLIDDPNFAIPFWNWDNPDGGMQMPLIYDNPNSPLFDSNRNKKHRPHTTLDLNYSKKNDNPMTKADLIDSNLVTMYRQMITHAKSSEGFLGKRLEGGDPEGEEGFGSIENTPHNNIHLWSGNPNSPYGEDLGNFYSAGRDVLFYGLHANVDRMWSIWKCLENRRHKDFTDTDWLDSSFVFFDENKNAIRIKVRDCLDTEQLGYVYQDVPIPWLCSRPTPSQSKKPVKTSTKKLSEDDESLLTRAKAFPEKVRFPVVLDSNITTEVKRPKKSRSRKNKNEEDEILVIEGIQYDRTSAVNFDVIVNVYDDDDVKNISPKNTEFAGSFTSVPHLHKHEKQKATLSLVITELLEDLSCDDDDTVLVTLVPNSGIGEITIDGIKITLSPLN